MCITNEGVLERGKISNKDWYTIDIITVKMSDGTRKRRYAVCVNGRWNSNQQMTLREARAEVDKLKEEANKPQTVPLDRKTLDRITETLSMMAQNYYEANKPEDKERHRGYCQGMAYVLERIGYAVEWDDGKATIVEA